MLPVRVTTSSVVLKYQAHSLIVCALCLTSGFRQLDCLVRCRSGRARAPPGEQEGRLSKTHQPRHEQYIGRLLPCPAGCPRINELHGTASRAAMGQALWSRGPVKTVPRSSPGPPHQAPPPGANFPTGSLETSWKPIGRLPGILGPRPEFSSSGCPG